MSTLELSLARVVELGRTTQLTLPVCNSAGVVQTVASGTLSIWLGSRLLVDAQAITSGAPPTYSLADTVTASEQPAEDYREVWTTDIGVFPVGGYLVKYGYFPTVTDTHLQQRHPEFRRFLPPGETTGEKCRTAAAEKIQRDLLKQGRRPWLIVDPWALHDAAVALSLHYWAQDAAMRTSGTNDYARLKAEYLAAYTSEMGSISFRYADEDGTVVADQNESAEAGGVMLTAGPRWPRRMVA